MNRSNIDTKVLRLPLNKFKLNPYVRTNYKHQHTAFSLSLIFYTIKLHKKTSINYTTSDFKLSTHAMIFTTSKCVII